MTIKQIGAAMRKARGERSIRSVAMTAKLKRDQVTAIEQATKNYTINSLLALAKVTGAQIKVEP